MLRFRRLVTAFAATVTASTVLVALTLVPSSAEYANLCSGYDGCQNAGYSHAGYKSASGTMYWSQYSGHNCTNYVAYRMVKNGMANTKPWSGLGNAESWGGYNKSKTDGTPRVGSVAWWGKNVPPMGEAGHVGYVEKVVSSTEFWMSSDSYGGTFHWTKVTKASSWPTGFIHFKDVLLKNTAKPSVSGTPKVGVKLTARAGTWTPSGAAYKYQWLANGAAISGATASTYTPAAAVQGKKLSVKVTASKTGFAAKSATSNQTAAVALGTIANTTVPTITGTAKVGEKLTANAGAWSPAGTYSFAWFADGVAIPEATASTLTLGPDQLAKKISVNVMATKSGYAAKSASSVTTTPVLNGDAAVSTAAPMISGTLKVGSTVTASSGEWNAPGLTFQYEWLVSGVVQTTTTPTYKIAAADAGKPLAVRVSAARPGYATAYATSIARTVAKQVSKASAKLKSSKIKKSKRGFVTVIVKASGFTGPTGKITIYEGSKKVGSATLKASNKGKVTIKLSKLKKGTHRLVAKYAGDGQIAKSSAKAVKLKVTE